MAKRGYGMCPNCKAKWPITEMRQNGYQCPECQHQFRVGSTIEVLSASGKVLTPCHPDRAQQEVNFRRATWEGKNVLRLRFSPELHKVYRNYVCRRDDGKCVWCGRPGETLDHIIPDSKGGMFHPKNLMYSCKECNQTRGNRDIPEYLAYRSGTGQPTPHADGILRMYEAALQHQYGLRKDPK